VSRRDLPVKLYYRIGEVAQAVGVQPHVLRYWESEFGSIRPQKSARGQRVYSHKDLEKLLRVKQLLHAEGYTIAGAKKKLREVTAEAPIEQDEMQAFAEKMRGDLRVLRDEIKAELDALDREE
jgi:DNA-binding transcriptional MerR regulator